MDLMKGLVYVSNLLQEALGIALGQMSLTPNDEYNDSYYTKYTYENLESLYDWITSSLQTINTNTASGINQGTQYLSDQIGTPTATGASRRLQGSGISHPRDTLHQRFEYIEHFLDAMSNDITNIGAAVGLKTQETSKGKAETNRGKTAKTAKKKKKNLFGQDDKHVGPGQDRLLQVSLSKQIEAKIDSQNDKMDKLEDLENMMNKLEVKMDKLEASQNEKMDKLEVKIDALSGLMAQLLGATQQKQE